MKTMPGYLLRNDNVIGRFGWGERCDVRLWEGRDGDFSCVIRPHGADFLAKGVSVHLYAPTLYQMRLCIEAFSIKVNVTEWDTSVVSVYNEWATTGVDMRDGALVGGW